ncbi:MAG: hypothetical protein L6437_02010 [Kiritimatiellae bacterium]|nr:hypothetical protein [Verrucomicrobiota bacterium]MBU4366393.1 hypothetical protein [Verrucomicrobiota bacterium]MCG2659006.1 hypothetical protein [Kiritimatiellia bacterium]
MNQRERWIATVRGPNPDKVLFYPGGASRAAVDNWHRQGLPPGADWYETMKRELGIEYEPNAQEVQPEVKFGMVPGFEVKIIERRGHNILVQDSIGILCEISAEHEDYVARNKQFPDYIGVKYVKHPVETRDEWERMKTRYNVDDPGRFPADFKERCRKMAMDRRTGVVGIGLSGVFWQMRDWMGLENFCIALIEQPALVKEMIGFYETFCSAVLEKTVAQVTVDWVQISEDMAYKGRSMISPAMIREFLLPTWKRWCDILKQSGCPMIYVDSDGYIAELIPLWIEAGINSNGPVEVAAGNDLAAYRKRFGMQMGYLGGIDKRAIVQGGAALKREMKRIKPVVKAGGYIPSCDHGIPPEVTWPGLLDYCRELARLTGWL